tara:strand:- start:5517 stop:6971 length:1455 start_codon:yes stop_codon:yes gene_type:complete
MQKIHSILWVIFLVVVAIVLSVLLSVLLSKKSPKQKRAVCASGGGIRAALFTTAFLAELNQREGTLDGISMFTGVSGGSWSLALILNSPMDFSKALPSISVDNLQADAIAFSGPELFINMYNNFDYNRTGGDSIQKKRAFLQNMLALGGVTDCTKISEKYHSVLCATAWANLLSLNPDDGATPVEISSVTVGHPWTTPGRLTCTTDCDSAFQVGPGSLAYLDYMFQYLSETGETLYSIDSSSIRDAALISGDPLALTFGAIENANNRTQFRFGDGAGLANLNPAAAIREGCTEIALLVNQNSPYDFDMISAFLADYPTSTDLDPSNADQTTKLYAAFGNDWTVVSLFGFAGEPTAGVDHTKCAMFTLTSFVAVLQELVAKKTSVIYVPLETRANDVFGVPGGRRINALIHANQSDPNFTSAWVKAELPLDLEAVSFPNFDPVIDIPFHTTDSNSSLWLLPLAVAALVNYEFKSNSAIAEFVLQN